ALSGQHGTIDEVVDLGAIPRAHVMAERDIEHLCPMLRAQLGGIRGVLLRAGFVVAIRRAAEPGQRIVQQIVTPGAEQPLEGRPAFAATALAQPLHQCLVASDLEPLVAAKLRGDARRLGREAGLGELAEGQVAEAGVGRVLGRSGRGAAEIELETDTLARAARESGGAKTPIELGERVLALAASQRTGSADQSAQEGVALGVVEAGDALLDPAEALELALDLAEALPLLLAPDVEVELGDVVSVDGWIAIIGGLAAAGITVLVLDTILARGRRRDPEQVVDVRRSS